MGILLKGKIALACVSRLLLILYQMCETSPVASEL